MLPTLAQMRELLDQRRPTDVYAPYVDLWLPLSEKSTRSYSLDPSDKRIYAGYVHVLITDQPADPDGDDFVSRPSQLPL